MSCNETRMALYAPILGTEGWSRTKILELARPILGEPTEIETSDNGEVDWFSYDLPPIKGRFHRVQEGVTTIVKAHSKNGIWLIRHTLAHSREDDFFSHRTEITDLITTQKTLQDKFTGVKCGSWFLHTQTWYNGSDEPVPV